MQRGVVCSLNGIIFSCVIIACATPFIASANVTPQPCGLYGQPPCYFLPAPPGLTPPCAEPGKTYCEQISSYPTYVINRLVKKLGFKENNLLVDETGDEFVPTFTQQSQQRHARDLSKMPAVLNTSEELEDNYPTIYNVSFVDIFGMEGGKNSRSKRQVGGRESLCESRSQFITPKAAMNLRGNWKYVVNDDGAAFQTVKAEYCSSNTCNFCQLPIGYSSRCEQKYVQKRLISLQDNGESLYTDIFWFPSCCVCTLSAN